MRRLLYIAGYGRSGSTVIAAVLGNHPSIASIGEACFLLDDWDSPSRRCSCGSPFNECHMWGDLALEKWLAPSNREAIRRVEKTRSLIAWAARRPSESTRRYGSYQKYVLDHVRQRTGREVVVDSSKSAWLAGARPLALKRFAGEDVCVLHLVRDGRSTLQSMMVNGSNWELEGHRSRRAFIGVRTVVGWVVANVAAALMRFALGGDRYLRIRYEDFLRDPEQVLRQIGDFLDLETGDLAAQVDRGESFAVGHMVGGNRVRLARQVKVQGVPGPQREFENRLRHRLLFAILGGWLNSRYGYGSI